MELQKFFFPVQMVRNPATLSLLVHFTPWATTTAPQLNEMSYSGEGTFINAFGEQGQGSNLLGLTNLCTLECQNDLLNQAAEGTGGQ